MHRLTQQHVYTAEVRHVGQVSDLLPAHVGLWLVRHVNNMAGRGQNGVPQHAGPRGITVEDHQTRLSDGQYTEAGRGGHTGTWFYYNI